MRPSGIILALVASIAAACSGPSADTVFLDGEVYTVDSNRSWAEAVAVDDGRIVFVGDSDAARKLVGTDTRVIDLNGRMLLPGFHDSHVHPMTAGTRIFRCQLAGLAWPEPVLAAIRKCAVDIEPGEWLRGVGLDDALFANGSLDRELLDEILPENVAFITTSSGFNVWTNSAGLRAAGLTATDLDPEHGTVVRDPVTREPTGVLLGPAVSDLYGLIPPPGADELRDALRSATGMAHRYGITSANEARIEEHHWEAFVQADEAGELALRVQGSQHWDPERGMDQLKEILRRRDEAPGPRFRADAVKFFLDGNLQHGVAALLQPYAGSEDHYGELAFDAATLKAIATRLDAEGFQLHFHAVGDAAVRQALDAIEAAIEANGLRDRRHQIAHLVLIDPADVPRFAELGVVADFQVIWAKDDKDRATDVALLGDGRAGRLIQTRSMIDSGARVVLGSDWISESMDPLFGIQVAVTRRPVGADAPTWLPEERISLDEAIAAYTINGAWLARQDDWTGSIEVGKAADLVVLSDNLFEVDAREIASARVEMTMIGGEVVYEALLAENDGSR
jgi:predicted amidohydrolase YtcJ